MRMLLALLIAMPLFPAEATEGLPVEMTPSRTAKPAIRHVNLDRPGVLEAIERDDPALYRRISALLDLAQAPTCEHVPQVLKVELQVGAYNCRSAMFLTSYPAKRHVTFTLDNTAYSSNVVQWRLAESRLHKAGNPR